jgi:tetratricopeptide (TPR) repeat protein
MGGANTESETIDLETPNFSEAEALFKQFLKRNPDDKLGVESYCHFLERHKKKPAVAHSYFSAYVERAASDVERLMAFAEFLHSSLNKHEDAKKAYQRSCVVFICLALPCVSPYRVMCCLVLFCYFVLSFVRLFYFGLCYLFCLVLSCVRAMALEPSNPSVLCTSAEFLFSLGDQKNRQEAMDFFRKALAIDPDHDHVRHLKKYFMK